MQFGYTALFMACQRDVDIPRMLLQCGADAGAVADVGLRYLLAFDIELICIIVDIS